MTNYNDGKWHGWNGGEMPVHGDSVVTFVGEMADYTSCLASSVNWDECGGFKVIREYVEPRAPREVWVAFSSDGKVKDVSHNREFLGDYWYPSVVKFREVLDDES